MIWHAELSVVVLIVYVKKDGPMESLSFIFLVRTEKIAGRLVTSLCLQRTTEVKTEMQSTI